MRNRFYTRLLLPLFATLLLSAQVYAQSSTGSLPALPESDAVLYINARRIMNEALPRILPEAEYAKVKTQLNDVKTKTGIDINALESAVIAMRFGKPITATSDFVIIIKGTFNADALISLARIGLQGKMREEKYASKSLTVFKLTDLLGASELKSLPVKAEEIAAVALDGNTIAAGSLSFMKATLDAGAGQKRINPDLEALVMRDPAALLSLAIAIPPGLFNSLIPAEAQGNDEIGKIISGIENFSLILGMNATDFPLQATVRTASAEHARTLSGLAEMGLRAIGNSIKDKQAQSMLDALKITTEGNNVQVQVPIPQETVATLIRESNKPKKDETAVTSTKEPPKTATVKPKPPTRRRTTRAKKP